MYENPAMLIGAILTLAALFILAPISLHVYGRYRLRKALWCPETGHCASVQINAGRAAGSSLFGEPKLRVKDCARWPERRDCDQGCLTNPPFPP